MKRSSIGIIFFTVFIDLVGFGMIIPLNPYLAREYGASAFEVGMLLSVYSLMQIVFSPIWGKWSDKIGRRPIILVSLVGTALSHVAFSFSGALWMLFVSRTLAGVFGANISTAMAYAADVTKDKDRSKGMGLVGAAIGLGFIFGPLFGGLLSEVGLKISEVPPFGHSFPALIAGLLCLANAVFAYFKLGESLPPSNREQVIKRESKMDAAMKYFARPVTGPLLLVTFLASFSMTQMEATLFLLVLDRFSMGLSTASMCFAYVGVIIAFTQGLLIRILLPIAGERSLMFWGTLLSGVGLGLIGVAPTIWVLAFVITIMSLGFGIRIPSLNGSISLTCPPQEQGSLMGVNQSLQALGRVLGPPLGGWLYGAFGPEVNFATAGGFGLLGLALIWWMYDLIPDTVKPASSANDNDVLQRATLGHADSFAPPQSVAPAFPKPFATGATQMSQPTPVVLPEKPRGQKLAEPPRIEHIRKEDRITLISAYQFRNLFSSNVNFLFFDLRIADAAPQYSRAIKTTEDQIVEELNKRTHDKRAPILILCEDGLSSRSAANKIADQGFINVVVIDGGARALNKTGHV